MPLKLYERPNGIWHIRGTVQGRRVDESARTRVKSEAEAIRAQLEADLFKRAVYGDASVATFAEAALAYMSAGGSRDHMKPLLEQIGLKRLREVNQTVVDGLAAKKPDAAPATLVRQIFTPVAAVMNFAASDAGGKLCDPVRFKKPKVRNARTDYLTADQAEAWLSALPPHLGRIFTFYLATGCRATEAIGLRWKDVSPELERVVFWETKGGYARSAYLQKRARLVMPERPKDEEARVFLNSRGEPWHGYDAINLMFKRTREKHPSLTPVHCHLLRHTWATWAYACTRDLTFLMQQGGWRSLSMVSRYTHAASADLARSVLKKGWEFGGREIPGLTPKGRKAK